MSTLVQFVSKQVARLWGNNVQANTVETHSVKPMPNVWANRVVVDNTKAQPYIGVDRRKKLRKSVAYAILNVFHEQENMPLCGGFQAICFPTGCVVQVDNTRIELFKFVAEAERLGYTCRFSS
jgi:hypothetical protein